MYFLTIPFRYSAANIRPNDMLAGMPAMSAIAGMAHNVQRLVRQQLEIPSFTSLAFSLVYFSLDRDSASPRRPPEGLGGGSDMKLPALMDIRRAHGEASLILSFDFTEPEDLELFSGLTSGSEGLGQLESVLSASLRFAGGEIFIGLPGEFGNSALNLGVQQSWADVLGQLQKAYPTQGLLIQDKSELVTATARERGLSSLEAMVELTYQSKLALKSNPKQSPAAAASAKAVESDLVAAILEEDSLDLDDLDLLDLDDAAPAFDESAEAPSEDLDGQAPYLGVLMPCAVGFHEVCAGHAGEGSYPHVYVESVLSLVRARSIASVKRDIRQDREPWQAHFWRWEHLPTHRIYRAVRHFSK